MAIDNVMCNANQRIHEPEDCYRGELTSSGDIVVYKNGILFHTYSINQVRRFPGDGCTGMRAAYWYESTGNCYMKDGIKEEWNLPEYSLYSMRATIVEGESQDVLFIYHDGVFYNLMLNLRYQLQFPDKSKKETEDNTDFTLPKEMIDSTTTMITITEADNSVTIHGKSYAIKDIQMLKEEDISRLSKEHEAYLYLKHVGILNGYVYMDAFTFNHDMGKFVNTCIRLKYTLVDTLA